MKSLLCLFILLLALPAAALDISGAFKQGGFIYGFTTPHTQVTLNELSTTADERGFFIFGLERNFPAEATLTAATGTQTLLIEPRTYQTQNVRGAPKRKVDPHPEDLARIQADSAAIKQARSVFEPLNILPAARFSWPVSDTVSGVYGSRRLFDGKERSWHKGFDIAAPTGTPVHAPADGVVRLALADSFFNGNLVILDHGHQFMTLYAHLDSLAVTTGQTVTQGEKLGEVGSTGRSTGPHLHWGLYWRDIALDPALLINAQ